MYSMTFREAVPEDAFVIAPRLRQRDRDELDAHTPEPHDLVLWRSISMSLAAWTCLINGRPEAVFGVVPIDLLLGHGSPWFLATSETDRVRREFLVHGMYYLERMKELMPDLENEVDARNTQSIRWLRRLGFRFDEAVPNEYSGMPFHRFYMTRGDLCAKQSLALH